jgi:dihydroorotate dehydrogenase (fumarate)
MDLSTRYLGLELPHPFMPGASPLVDNLDLVRRLEDAGAAAVVMHSLFEEQLVGEQLATHHYMEAPAESSAEARSYMPRPPDFALGPEEYLEQLRKVKEAVAVPVIGSLNGTTPGGWLDYARLLAEAGADAIELNVFEVATDPGESGDALEQRTLEMVRSTLAEVTIPVAIKLSPFYTSLAHFASHLDQVGVHGMVLFNRFYQADIDVEALEAVPALHLSNSPELLLRLQWLAILSGDVKASLAVSGGVHTPIDAIKAVMAGAHAVQLVSALLRSKPEYLRTIREAVAVWMEEHEYESLEQMQGSMNLHRCPDPKAFTRTNYLRILQSWKGFLSA